MSMPIEKLAINTIRTLTIDSVEKANHGHPGMPMGAAPMAYTLWTRIMNQNPKNPRWFNRDRFVLSAGHGSMLLYSLLHLSGFDLSIEDLKQFRQWGSKTPGHPEYGHTPGVEATTGPLGQGIAMSVGMAMAERHMAKTYNREGFPIVDHYTYSICGDGDLMEGISSEAASLAGHLKLGRLILLFDSNDTTLDGPLNISSSENMRQRFESYGWQVLYVGDGNDVNEIERMLHEAKRDTERPTLIEIKTTIGYGAPSISGTSDAHSDPIGPDEIKKAKSFYQWDFEDDFFVPDEVYKHFNMIAGNGMKKENEWGNLFYRYKQTYPELAKQLQRVIENKLPEDWEESLPAYKIDDNLATRAASSKALNTLAGKLPELIGGSADLDSSTKTKLHDFQNFNKQNYAGRNVWFGVREFAMAAIANGMALHGGLRPFVGTFFVFSDYLRPALRLSALMGLPITYVFTHDSIAVGQDGPTHQPIEQLTSFRAMPGVTVIRPADGNETSESWKVAMKNTKQPTILVLGRQGLPTLQGTDQLASQGVEKGAYILSKAQGEPDGLLIASGSEVSLAMEAKEKLEKEGFKVSVISMPSWELFEKQPIEYREQILPKKIKTRLAVEMASTIGWKTYVGDEGAVIGVGNFGASGPGDRVIREYGFTVENVFSKMRGMLEEKATVKSN
ncbi:transketolase [Scopulibacillus darangshiensis]|uniref:Transketolase n=1 Tax=Scopulibacillus darangshiensis TaxID=442528 RepID=A0A4R2P012_9BACL|nr:transketolase [Scopulibacillus darangshiensis]TCP27832.1 transketolase [Scopulibacillus darangshiensis]